MHMIPCQVPHHVFQLAGKVLACNPSMVMEAWAIGQLRQICDSFIGDTLHYDADDAHAVGPTVRRWMKQHACACMHDIAKSQTHEVRISSIDCQKKLRLDHASLLAMSITILVTA